MNPKIFGLRRLSGISTTTGARAMLMGGSSTPSSSARHWRALRIFLRVIGPRMRLIVLRGFRSTGPRVCGVRVFHDEPARRQPLHDAPEFSLGVIFVLACTRDAVENSRAIGIPAECPPCRIERCSEPLIARLLRQPELLVQVIEPRLGGNVLPAPDPLLDGIPRDLVEIDTWSRVRSITGARVLATPRPVGIRVSSYYTGTVMAVRRRQSGKRAVKSGPLRQQSSANVPRHVWDPKGRFQGITQEYGRYKAKVHAGGRTVDLGRWATPQEAAVAIDRAVLHFGLDQPLIYPKKSKALGSASPEELRRNAIAARKSNRATPVDFVGVYLEKGGRWCAGITVEYAVYRVTGYLSAEDAAVAYDRLVLRHREPITAGHDSAGGCGIETTTSGSCETNRICLA